MALASLLPRDRPLTSDNDLTPVVQILTWLLLSFSILFVGAQFATKRALGRHLNAADLVLLVALVFDAGQKGTLLSSPGQNVGRSSQILTNQDITDGLKILYAGDILNIFCLALTKSSLLVSLSEITPMTTHSVLLFTTGVTILIWACTGIFTSAFQCQSPRWDVIHGTCVEIHSYKTYIAILNILTDFALVAIPVAIIAGLHMPQSKKITLLGGFCTRIFVIIATIIQITFIRDLQFDDQYILQVWRPVILTQIVQSTSIITACIPFLKPLLISLESGFLRADNESRRTITGSYKLSKEQKDRWLPWSSHSGGRPGIEPPITLGEPSRRWRLEESDNRE